MNKDIKAKINKIIRFSNVDGPGNRLTIFFQGCNFDCGYCHNPETINICNSCGGCIEVCPTNCIKKIDDRVIFEKEHCIDCDSCIKICDFNSSPKCMDYTVDELLTEIEKVKSFIKGITVSGGEATLQHLFITKLFKEVKRRWENLTCFVDTNGGVDLKEKEYEEFVKVTDFFMLDVKAWDNEEHTKLTKHSNEVVLKNLNFLKSIDKLYEVRTVIYSENIRNELTVKKVSETISNTNIGYKIIKYRGIGVREDKRNLFTTPTNEEMERLKTVAISSGAKEQQIIII